MTLCDSTKLTNSYITAVQPGHSTSKRQRTTTLREVEDPLSELMVGDSALGC